MKLVGDSRILRDLATRYAEICATDEQRRRRDLWRAHNSLIKTRPPIYVRAIPWDDTPELQRVECADPYYQQYESWFRLMLCHAATGDDYTFNPWVTVEAVHRLPPEGIWGLRIGRIPSPERRGSWMFDPPIRQLTDRAKMVFPHHEIDEVQSAERQERLHDAIGDILPVVLDRAPCYRTWNGDISTQLAYLRGLEQMMWDLMDNPEWLHGLLAFMRDGILATHEQAEAAGDWRLCDHQNQAMSYAQELPDPAADPAPVTRRQLWVFCASQETTGVSPAMFDQFMLQYQLPIIEKFGLTAYGCCEDLSEKIGVLRQIPNLRRIAVAPRANLRRCAEQIGTDYVISWRPNPADTVSCGFNPDRIRRATREALEITKGLHVDITLKDVETVEGHPERLHEWVQIVREIAEDY